MDVNGREAEKPSEPWPDFEKLMDTFRKQGMTDDDDSRRQRKLFESWLEFNAAMKRKGSEANPPPATAEAPKQQRKPIEAWTKEKPKNEEEKKEDKEEKEEEEEDLESGLCTATRWTTRTTLLFGVIAMSSLAGTLLYLESIDASKKECTLISPLEKDQAKWL